MRTQLRTATSPLATDIFKVGETGETPKKPSKRAKVTFTDSISASTLVGNPSEDMETCKYQKVQTETHATRVHRVSFQEVR